MGLPDAGDPRGEVKTAWHAKEVIRQIYTHTDGYLAEAFVERLGSDLQDDSCPPEVSSLGRTPLRCMKPNRCLASRRRLERTNRSCQQPDQTDKTDRLRVPTVPQLPDPGPSLHRETQLGPPRHDHTRLKYEVPQNHHRTTPTITTTTFQHRTRLPTTPLGCVYRDVDDTDITEGLSGRRPPFLECASEAAGTSLGRNPPSPATMMRSLWIIFHPLPVTSPV